MSVLEGEDDIWDCEDGLADGYGGDLRVSMQRDVAGRKYPPVYSEPDENYTGNSYGQARSTQS